MKLSRAVRESTKRGRTGAGAASIGPLLAEAYGTTAKIAAIFSNIGAIFVENRESLIKNIIILVRVGAFLV